MEYNSKYIVNGDQLLKNISNIRNAIGRDVKFCAIVKADAYGLGIDHICPIIKDNVDYFGVATLSEALKIRAFDNSSKILLLGAVDYTDIKECIDNNISISVGSLDLLYEVVKYSNAKIHLQINTGMNRYGFRSLSLFSKAIKIISNSNCVLEGVYSHFATKENDIMFMKKQLYKFLQYKKLIKNNNLVVHISNSFGIVLSDRYYLDMVRSGMLMYGGMHNNIGNKLILSIKSKIIAIQNVKKGETVGYDRTFKAIKNMHIGIVGMGYADGLDRRLSNNFNVLINDNKCPIIGYICMDIFMVDITNTNATVGDEVTILGTDCNNSILLDDMAKATGASSYELMCRFNTKRMNKIVLRG